MVKRILCLSLGGSGHYWCETIIHGTANSPEGLSGKTTKETRILDPMSQEVLGETWVCLGGPNYDRVAWTFKAYDEWQHPILVEKSNGEKIEASWGANCCGKEWEIGPDGVEYNYEYNGLAQMVGRVKKAANPNGVDLWTFYTTDVLGRRLTESLSAGGLSQQVSSNVYDLAGRLVSSIDGQGIQTAYREVATSRTTIRGGVTNTTVNYLDGRTKSTSENSTLKSYHEYGVNPDGTRWTKAYSGPLGSNSPAWQKTTTDLLGRTIKDEKPGYGGTVITTTYVYNTKGQLISTTQQPNSSTTLSEYNELGQQTRSGLDVNNNGSLDLASPDRISESSTWFDKDESGNYWQTRASLIYAGNSAIPTTNSIQKTRLAGLGISSGFGLLDSEFLSTDLLGNPTTSRTYINRTAKTVTQVVSYPDSTNAAIQVTINGLQASSTSKTGVRTDYTQDALGRQISASSPSPSRG
jgi:hypothetical protein